MVNCERSAQEKAMATAALTPMPLHSLTAAQFQSLSAIPPEAEWFANVRNRHTRENYARDIR
jgi:hypothetical protein